MSPLRCLITLAMALTFASPAFSSRSAPSAFVNVGDVVYFVRGDAESGRELWRTDGTRAGTAVVKDILPGSQDGISPFFPERLMVLDGIVYFAAGDSTHGAELWRSDGTTDGTFMVKDTWPGPPGQFRLPNGAPSTGPFFFAGGAEFSAFALWKSDGTEAGTRQVKDVLISNGSLDPPEFAYLHGTVFFSAYDETTGYDLWKSDGTEAGTVIVKDVSDVPMISNLYAAGDLVYFIADDVTGRSLWRTDGTDAGTFHLYTLEPGRQWQSPPIVRYSLFARQGVLYVSWNGITDNHPFTFRPPVSGYELIRSDGTVPGTYLLKDICPGTCPGGGGYVSANIGWETSPFGPAVLGDRTFFIGRSGQLWSTDGTNAGTEPATPPLGNTPWQQAELLAANDRLYFLRAGGEGGRLWSTDGTPNGLKLLAPDAAGGNSFVFGTQGPVLATLNGGIFFASRGLSTGEELWRHNGATPGDGVLLRDIQPGKVGSFPRVVASAGGLLYFTADNRHGHELWRTDGTTAGTVQLTNYPIAARMAGPVPGSALGGSSATFGWTGGKWVDKREILVGTTPGGSEIYSRRMEVYQLDTTVSGLPVNGQPIYVRLGSYLVDHWEYVDYTYIAAGGTVDPARASDFNADGDADVLWQHTNGSTYVWYLNGLAQVGGQYVSPEPLPDWRVVTTGDLNRDGSPDIVSQHPDGRVRVAYMRERTPIGEEFIREQPMADWRVVGSGDFNADGGVDLVWQHADGRVYVWFLNGAALTGGRWISSLPMTGWRVAAAGDFNGDGRPDLVWQADNGATYLWILTETTQSGGGWISDQALADWRVVGSAELSGDGRRDLVWQHPDGRVYVWFLNGLTMTGGQYLRADPLPGWKVAAIH
jgi:ELWxxDGT repeat protein